MKHRHRPSMPAILVLNQMAGPMTRELCEDLADAYGTVHLLTGHPDTLATLNHPGVCVTRAAAYQRGGRFRRLFSWLRYLVQAACWLVRYDRDVPLLIFSNPPQLVWIAAANKWWRGTRFVAVVHDIYPDVIVRQRLLPERSIIIRSWRSLNRLSYQKADAVVTLGRYMAKTLAAQFNTAKTAPQDILVVSPWADSRRLAPLPKSDNPFARKHGLIDHFTVAYSGNMGWGHDLQTVLEAARALRHEQDRLKFLWIGAGPRWDWLREELNARPEPHVVLLPWVAENELRYSLSAADLAIVSLEAEMSQLAVPSKAFSFLAAGVPLVAICDEETELAELVHEFDCGIVIPPGHPARLEQVILDALNRPSQHRQWRDGAHAAAQHFDRARQGDSMVAILDQYVMSDYPHPVNQVPA